MNNKSKKPLVTISVLILIVIISISVIFYARETKELKNNVDDKNQQTQLSDSLITNDDEIVNELSTDKDEKENETKAEDNKSNNTKSTKNETKQQNSNTTTKNDSNSSSNNSNKNENTSSNTSTSSDNNSNQNNNTNENTNAQQTETKPNTTPVEDDGVDTSNPDYHIHKGVIECYSQEDCESKTFRIQLKFRKSIDYANYIDVVSKKGNTLGYYIQYVFKIGNYDSYDSCVQKGNEIKETINNKVTGYECDDSGNLKINSVY